MAKIPAVCTYWVFYREASRLHALWIAIQQWRNDRYQLPPVDRQAWLCSCLRWIVTHRCMLRTCNAVSNSVPGVRFVASDSRSTSCFFSVHVLPEFELLLVRLPYDVKPICENQLKLHQACCNLSSCNTPSGFRAEEQFGRLQCLHQVTNSCQLRWPQFDFANRDVSKNWTKMHPLLGNVEKNWLMPLWLPWIFALWRHKQRNSPFKSHRLSLDWVYRAKQETNKDTLIWPLKPRQFR